MRLLVVGMARSGAAAARLALRRGWQVTTTDARADAPEVAGATAVHGRHRREDFLAADLIVVSPGVPSTQPDLAAAKGAGVPILGELAFAASMIEAPILAVSGTNGKSTTTWLCGQLCEQAGMRAFVGGNLGNPLSNAVDGGWDVCVAEVSSYQMEFPGAFRPRAAAILNLTPDHLERHRDMETYGEHKCRMFARMGPEDAAIVPAGDSRLVRLADARPGTRLFLGGAPGVRDLGQTLEVSGTADPGELPLAGFPLAGRHNRENLAAAVLLASWVGLRRRDVRLADLRGLPHRMELVAERAGVRWIDDSKATNVDAALAAYSGVDGPFVALLGGRGKAGASYEALVGPLVSARAVVCFGEEGPRIAAVLRAGGVDVRDASSLADAVRLARGQARPGDSVLLSPACASFDAFTDFEHRGRVFAELAREFT
jgi:UDP-N-acetylmuramoylalanine--D-glutamate ligase